MNLKGYRTHLAYQKNNSLPDDKYFTEKNVTKIRFNFLLGADNNLSQDNMKKLEDKPH